MNTGLCNEIVQQAHWCFVQGGLWGSLTTLLYILISRDWYRSSRTVGRESWKWKPYMRSGPHITDARL